MSTPAIDLPTMEPTEPVVAATVASVPAKPNAAQSHFGWTSVGHMFASAFNELHKGLLFAATEITKVDTPQVQATVEGITSVLPVPGASQAVLIERAAFSALGTVLAAVNAAGTASAANGLNVQLDAAAVAAFKQLVADSKDDLKSLGYNLG